MVSVIQRNHMRWVVLLAALFWVILPMADELESVVGQPEAEKFSLVDLNGKTHRLSEYRGSVVLVSFWATWCPQCIWEMPSLRNLSNMLPKEKFVILAINVGEERKPIQSFVEQNNIAFPILLDHDLETYKKWPVLGIPASFLIDQRGKIVYTVVGALEWTHPAILSTIRRLVVRH